MTEEEGMAGLLTQAPPPPPLAASRQQATAAVTAEAEGQVPSPPVLLDYQSVFPSLGHLVSRFYDRPIYLQLRSQSGAKRRPQPAMLPWTAQVSSSSSAVCGTARDV